MKEIMVKQYQCDHCSKTSQWAHELERHEKTCLQEQEKQKQVHEEYRQRTANAKVSAIEAAKNDAALKLLVAHGFEKEALQRCCEIYWSQVCFDHCCSSWFDEVYAAMVEAAKPPTP